MLLPHCKNKDLTLHIYPMKMNFNTQTWILALYHSLCIRFYSASLPSKTTASILNTSHIKSLNVRENPGLQLCWLSKCRSIQIYCNFPQAGLFIDEYYYYYYYDYYFTTTTTTIEPELWSIFIHIYITKLKTMELIPKYTCTW